MSANHLAEDLADQARVLIVDDDPLIREGLLAILECGGRRLVACSDAVSAELAIRQIPFTHVVSDLQLSTMPFEGLTFVDHVRRALPDSRIVVMTGYGSDLVKSTALAVGADAFLAKPFDTEQIAGALRLDLGDELCPAEDTLRVPDIADVLERGIEPHFQPVVDICSRSAEICGFESLARLPEDGWPLGGMATLFEYARRAGRLEELNAMCLEAALARGAANRGAIFVGVDPQVIGSRRILDTFRRVISEKAIDPRRIVVELSDGPYDSVQLLGAIDALRLLGVSFAIAGAENAAGILRVIDQIRPAYIRIGARIGAALHSDPSVSAIVRRVVALAAAISADVILEGIESREALLHARRFNIRYGQGSWLGSPIPADALATYSSSITN